MSARKPRIRLLPRTLSATVDRQDAINTAPTAGERWVADQLTALRHGHFTRSAITAFLTASFARAAESRRERPELAGQTRRWLIAGISGALAIREVAALCAKPVPDRGFMAWWLALEAMMVDWHLGMLESPSGKRRDALSAADALTLIRAAAAPLAAAAPPDAAWFILLLGLAGATDLLDGQLARRTGVTRFGRDFDSLADLAFRTAAIHGAHREGWIDSVTHRVLTGRQVLFAGRAVWDWFARSHRPVPDPSPLSRWHVPLMLGGLAISAARKPGGGNVFLRASTVVGSLGVIPGLCSRLASRATKASHQGRKQRRTAEGDAV
jgi:phosphatidylglycerophosphate synthase